MNNNTLTCSFPASNTEEIFQKSTYLNSLALECEGEFLTGTYRSGIREITWKFLNFNDLHLFIELAEKIPMRGLQFFYEKLI